MQQIRFTSPAGDGATIVCHEWPFPEPRAVVLIAHGAAEYGRRYARFAGALNAAGYTAIAIDHRGHGETGRLARLGVFAADDGWNRAVADIHHLVGMARAMSPALPLVLFGHSMGSLLAQQYIAEHGDALAGCVLSGSALVEGFAALEAPLAEELAMLGRDAPSQLMSGMMGGGFNAGIDDPRTPFDWLSRDAAEVDAYIADPLCGFALSCGAWHDMFTRNRVPKSAPEFERVPKELALLVLAGDRDPLNDNLAALHELAGRYRAAGLTRVTERYYPGGRHEMLNETNRAEVTADVVAWLAEVVRH